MRRLFGWLAGLAGIAALARILVRRSSRPEEAPTPSGEQNPADALRRTLSDVRAKAPSEPPESLEEDEEDEGEPLDERRARIHAKAQDAIAEMQEPPE